MKNYNKKIIISVMGAIILLCSINADSIIISKNEQKTGFFEEWTGEIRIEGETATIWKGIVSFSSSEIEAENMETHEIETHIIPYPSPLGAIDEAAKLGSFSYTAVYYPSWDSLLITEIGGDICGEKTGWIYFIDYEMPLIGADKYELTIVDEEILWGFLYFENWEVIPHALKINLDKDTVKTNEEFTVTVFNESDNPVEDAVVHIDSMTLTTNENGQVTTSMGTAGIYEIFAEKDPTTTDTYIRSEITSLQVKKAKNKCLKSIYNILYLILQSQNFFQ